MLFSVINEFPLVSQRRRENRLGDDKRTAYLSYRIIRIVHTCDGHAVYACVCSRIADYRGNTIVGRYRSVISKRKAVDAVRFAVVDVAAAHALGIYRSYNRFCRGVVDKAVFAPTEIGQYFGRNSPADRHVGCSCQSIIFIIDARYRSRISVGSRCGVRFRVISVRITRSIIRKSERIPGNNVRRRRRSEILGCLINAALRRPRDGYYPLTDNENRGHFRRKFVVVGGGSVYRSDRDVVRSGLRSSERNVIFQIVFRRRHRHSRRSSRRAESHGVVK